MSVLLPAPFSPRIACTSPARASNDTPRNARVVDKESMVQPEVKELLKPDLKKWLNE